MKKVSFKNSRRQKIVGILDLPKADKTMPLVLCLHGFGGTKESNQEWTDILNPLGVATLRIDFHGSGESKGLFEEKTISGFIDDAESALRYISELRNIDQAKIGIAGTSMGAVTAILTASKSKKISCLVALCPAVEEGNVIASLYDDADFDRVKERGFVQVLKNGMRQKLNYSFFEDAKTYPLTQIAQKIHYPFLVIMGEKDTVVPFEQVEIFATKVSSAKLIALPDSDHDLEADWPIVEKAIREWFIDWITK